MGYTHNGISHNQSKVLILVESEANAYSFNNHVLSADFVPDTG